MADSTMALSLVIGATLGAGFNKTFRSAQDTIEGLGKTADKLSLGKQLSGEIVKLETKLGDLKRKQAAAGDGADALAQDIGKVEGALSAATEKARKHGLKIGDAKEAYKRFGTQLDKTQGKIGRIQRSMVRRQKRQAITGQAAGVVGMAYAAAKPIQAAIEFESAMADVKKIIDFETPAQFREMSQDVLRLSQRIPTAAEGIAEIMTEAGQAGIARDELLGFAEASAKMGVAFDISGREAGSAMAELQTIFGLGQEGVVGLGDAFNHLSNNLAATAPDLLNIANRTGSTAKMFGLSGEQVGSLGAAFLALKTPPEVAATGINAILLKLATADQQGKKFQDALGGIGMSAGGLKTAIEQDAQGALLGFLEAVRGSDDVVGALAAMFGAEYADDMAKLVGGLDTYKQALGLTADETQYAGSMQGEYNSRAATTENNLQLLKNSFNALGVNLGSTVLPTVTDMTLGLTGVTGKAADLAAQNPVLTTSLTGLTTGIVATKAAMMALSFGGTIVMDVYDGLTDGWGKAKDAVGFLRANVTKANLVAVASAAKIKIVTAAQWLWNAALNANPIGLVVAAVAALAAGVFVVYKNWEPIKEFFGKIWEGIKASAGAAWEGIKTFTAAAWESGILPVILGPIGIVIRYWDKIKAAAVAVWEGIKTFTAAAVAVWEGIVDFFSGDNLGGKMIAAGKSLIGALANGLKTGALIVYEALKWILEPVGKLLPNSDAKEGPLSRLTASGQSILGTMGAGVRRAGAAGLQRPLTGALRTAAAGLALTLPVPPPAGAVLAAPAAVGFEPAAARPGAPAAAPTYNITIHQQPGEDAQALVERVIEAIEERRGVDARGRLYDG